MAQIYLIKNILQLLTPEEILELTTISRGEEKFKLTLIVQDRLKEINNTNARDGIIEVAEKIEPGNEQDIKERIKEDLLNSEDAKLEKVEKVPTERKGVVFFLDIKRKTRKSQKSLKQKEVMSLYQSNAAIDIDQEKSCHEDLNKSLFKGVLVDKKQS